MIYLIFTQDGFEEAKNIIIEEKATLWVNEDLLSDQQISELTQAAISVHTLPNKVDPNDEKSILAALKLIEQDAPKTEIFVEYL
ncbi:MAG: hypothetical protein OEW63_05745 [Gammaproteobacteria bacterium]|nr:hypothetical protein [Gammaproteobacteria bacterium]